jgi:arginyl-tRNA synthetase
MSIFSTYTALVHDVLTAMMEAGELLNLPIDRVAVEPPREAAHGDLATNAAMVLAKPASLAPRALADLLKPRIEALPDVTAVEIAGPGFINIRLQPSVWQNEVKTILAQGTHYGDSELGRGKPRVNIEYVSVNPTGPMHAGHVRGAVVGDTLANLLHKVGYDITREYYFNDGGTQIDVLGRTAYLRYREALGEDIGEIPEGLYPGEYLKDVGTALAARDGDKWLGKPESEWLVPVREFAVQAMMVMIKSDLELIAIHHDVFTNERELVDNGTLETAFKILEDKGLIYTGILPPPRGKEMEDWEPVPLTLFRSSNFGDTTDRPLKKRDGNWAYIMPDIAYHYDKIQRGFGVMINLLGADHGGYLERMRPAVAAFSDGKAELDVIFVSIVKMFVNGEPVKLSKRSGNLITLREMVEQVGMGAVRFIMLTRDPKSSLDFDFAKAVEQSKDNPVFYVQYAHARCCSVLRTAKQTDAALMAADLSLLTSPDELAVIKTMATWPRVVEMAAEVHEPHRIAFYVQELAAAFHLLWTRGNENATLRFILEDEPALTLARLALVRAVALVLASGLEVLGVEPLEELRA